MKKGLLTIFALLTGMLLVLSSIVWAQAAPVAKTGQTTSYATGDDGDLQKGVASPDPRFTDNGDGTVTDNLTGLMWAKDAYATGGVGYAEAIDYANNLSLGSAGCGEYHTDWRLPNAKEILSLLDLGNSAPALPSGHPFTNSLGSYLWYWTSTTCEFYTQNAFVVYMGYGFMNYTGKEGDEAYNSVWPVRSVN